MILDTLAMATKKRVERDMEKVSLEEMVKKAKQYPRADTFVFEEALRKKGIGFICEVKKASPSKGIIANEFPYIDIAKEYEAAGADCISILTETDYFLGSDLYLEEIRKEVKIPILRKDFTIDAYQIYQAKVLGADAVLLICSILTKEQIETYLRICEELRLSAVVEAHDEQEVQMAISCGARIIGVNNRNLKTFDVNVQNSETLRELVPNDIIFVAESGIKTAEDISRLKDAKVNAVLIGETLMLSKDKKKKLAELRGAC